MVECKVTALILYHHTNTVSTEPGSFGHTTQTQCFAAKEPGCGWPWPGQPAMLRKATLANAPLKNGWLPRNFLVVDRARYFQGPSHSCAGDLFFSTRGHTIPARVFSCSHSQPHHSNPASSLHGSTQLVWPNPSHFYPARTTASPLSAVVRGGGRQPWRHCNGFSRPGPTSSKPSN
jgi:hypothetical protein